MSDYFDASDHTLTAGTRARAAVVNAALEDIEVGFEKLPSETNIKMGLVNYAVDSGAANAYVVALPHTPSAYTDGLQVVFKASAANTGACTINVNALGVKTITRQDGTTPIAGDIGVSKITEIRYNSTSENFEIQGSIGAAAGTGTMAAQNANAVDIVGGTIAGITAEADAGAVVTVDGTQTLTNKTHTSPKINEDVALTVTSTQVNAVAASASSGSSALGGDFSSGTIYWYRSGGLVTVYWNVGAFVSAATASSAVGVVVEGFRPGADHYSTIRVSASGFVQVTLNTAGTLTVSHFDSDCVARSDTDLWAHSITYRVA